jgi:hypothetical protein
LLVRKEKLMKKLLLSLMAATLMLAFLATFGLAAPGDVTDPDALEALAAARRATAKYHDVSVAEADGYSPTPMCVEQPGLGGMGIHYLNFSLFDATVDPLTPEGLLYAPTDEGLRLVGVVYVVVDTGQLHPTLFGQPMIGPMTGGPMPGGGSMPPHYHLHAWLWQGNPAGIFADFNPNVRC